MHCLPARWRDSGSLGSLGRSLTLAENIKLRAGNSFQEGDRFGERQPGEQPDAGGGHYQILPGQDEEDIGAGESPAGSEQELQASVGEGPCQQGPGDIYRLCK